MVYTLEDAKYDFVLWVSIWLFNIKQYGYWTDQYIDILWKRNTNRIKEYDFKILNYFKDLAKNIRNVKTHFICLLGIQPIQNIMKTKT